MKKAGILLLIGIVVTVLTGCNASSTNTTSTAKTASASAASYTYLNAEDLFSDRDKEIGYDESECVAITLDGTYASCTSDAVTVKDSTITISEEGSYLLTGTLDNGLIIVDAKKTDKIQLILNGVDISNENGASIYVKQADKVFVTLAADTQNTLSNTSGYTAIDDTNIDAVIFSKEDLTLNGSGSLTINADYGHGIVSKDSLVITGGGYNITSEKHAIYGKDSVCLAAGTFTLDSGSDSIHAENVDDTALGFLYIGDGTFYLTSQKDGLSSSGVLQIDNGTFQIATADNGEDVSTIGVKATAAICILDGTFSIDSSDDSIHSNADVRIENGTFTLFSGDDGIHADSNLAILNGTITVSESYEGLEGQNIDINDGTIKITSSDDGLNAAGGNDQSTTDGRAGMDQFAADEDAYINITGGQITVAAGGDGIDSNGDLSISGGNIQVTNTAESGNGVIDYNGTGTITGGTFLSSGFSGMTQNFGDASTQGCMLVNVDTQAAQTEVALTDSDGNTLLAFTPEYSYNSILVSCSDLAKGGVYTLTCGSSETSVTMDSLIYGSSGQMGGRGSGNAKGGGMKGSGDTGTPPSGVPGDGQAPDGEAKTLPEDQT